MPAESKAAAAVERMLGTAVLLSDPASKPSIISEGFSLTGDVVSRGTLHIDGQITGTIKVDAVAIGPKGVVSGSVECSKLLVKGILRGTSECDDLQIDSTATVEGTVSYRVLAVQRGATITGDLLVRK